MSFFSRTTDTEKQPVPSVPQDIRNAVNVMSSTSTHDDKSVRPATSSPFQTGASPFLSAIPEKTEELVAKPPLPLEKKEIIPEAVSQKTQSLFTLNKKKVVFIALIAAGVIVIGVLAWYFLKDTSTEVASPEPVVTEEIPVSPPVEIVVSLPFVPDAPNYLSLDTETVTEQSLNAMLSEAGAKIREANMGQPIEFLLTDKNNNPLAFSRFAYLMNIEFSEELLASFGETFSLFLFNDVGVIKTGLELMFIDPVKSEALMKSKEKSLPYSFRTVLFQGFSVPRELVFRSGIYKDQSVRFVNIDTAQNISFDYAFRENRIFIGTSKDTLRAILDKK